MAAAKRGSNKGRKGRGRERGRGGGRGGGDAPPPAAAAAAPELEEPGAAPEEEAAAGGTSELEDIQKEVARLQTKKGRLEKAVRQLEEHLQGRAEAGAGEAAGDGLVSSYVLPVVQDILQPMRGGAVTPSSVVAAAAIAVSFVAALRASARRG